MKPVTIFQKDLKMNLEPIIKQLLELEREATPGDWEPCLGSGNNECTAIHFIGNKEHPFGLMVCDLIPDYMLSDAHKKDLEFKNDNMAFLIQSRNNLKPILESWLKMRVILKRVVKSGCDPIDQDNCLACDAKDALGEESKSE